MSIAIPEWLAPWLVGAGLVSIALALIVTIRAYIQLRRAEYYVIREEARRIVLRASLAGFILTLLTIFALFVPRQASTPQPTATPIPLQTLIPTPSRVVPTPTATVLSTPQATATEPFIPTSTPQATLPAAFTSPLPSAIPPPGDARFEFWTLAKDVDSSDQPVEPSTQFTEGTESVFLFFRYDGLLPNVPWTIIWFGNGELLNGSTRLWEPQKPTGERYEFLKFPGGYPAGEYEVQVWLGERPQVRAVFLVVGAEGTP
jgi:hypothetical protein